MSSRAFITADQVVPWSGITSGHDNTIMTDSIEAACAWIENRCRVRLLTGSYSVWHSGDLAITPPKLSAACDLYLCDPNGGHLLLPITAATITEEGTALTSYLMSTATTFTDSENAVLIFDKAGIARRVSINDGIPAPKDWEGGHTNIYAAITAGYTAWGGADPCVPFDLVQVAKHIAAIFYREGKRAGVSTQNDGTMSLGYDRLLPPNLKEALDFYTFPAVPRTFEG